VSQECRGRVLAIDDQPEIQELIREALTLEGYEVETSGDPVESLEWMRRRDYDLVVLDFNLPAMDGITLHREIAGISPRLAERSIFISGLIQSKENLDYFYTHGGAYLSKPFRLQDLVTAVRQVVSGAGPG
jgi:DNA-binding response OmpR family regulator